jgi:hypothetical protein
VKNEVKLLAHKRKEELDPDDCIYDEVMIFSLYHFVQKSKGMAKKKLKRIWDTITMKNSKLSLLITSKYRRTEPME